MIKPFASTFSRRFLLLYSYIQSLKDVAMLPSAECAQDIERATEASITLILQIVALSSGIFQEEDYLIDFTTLTGTEVKMINQRKNFY